MKTFSSQTKTNFRRRSSRRKKVLILGASALGVIFALAFLRAPLGYMVGFGVAPAREAAVSGGGFLGRIGAYFRGVDALLAERSALEDALQAKDAELATLAARATDAALLATLEAPHRIAAGVLFSPSHTPYDTLVIDKGTADGIARGRIVYGPGDVAIGIVRAVYAQASLVQLFTSPGVESRVYVHGPDIAADAIGVGGGVLRVTIPQGIEVPESSPVVLPTLSPAVFGEVSSVEADPASPTVSAYVTLPVALSGLRFVTVADSEYIAPRMSDIEAAIRESDPDLAAYFQLSATSSASTTESEAQP